MNNVHEIENRIDQQKIPQRTLCDGRKVPCIGMGTFGSDKYSPEQVAIAVAGAVRAGYRLIDCASVYGNERQIGDVLFEAVNSGVVEREELFIMSKVWNDMHDAGDVLKSLKKTLVDLRLEYIDAYFVHWPFPNYHAPGCGGDARNPDSKPFSAEHYISVWRQMEELVDMGLAGSIGMSNMTISKMDAVMPCCRIRPAMLEMELHPSFQQPELFDYCVSYGIVPVGYCPIGSPNRPERDKADGDIACTDIPEIIEIARAHGVHPAIICLKWAVQRGQIPIPFSVSEDKYVSNLRCVTEDPLTLPEMRTIAGLDRNCRLIKGQVFLWEGAKSWEDLWE